MSKPVNKHKQGKRLTVMMIPDSSAKIKKLHIPYWVFGLLGVPFICIILLIVLYQSHVANLEQSLDDNSKALDKVISENKTKSDLIDALIINVQEANEAAASSYIAEPEPETEPEIIHDDENTGEDDWADEESKRKIEELIKQIEAIDGYKREIVEVFQELAELGVPFTFDENTLDGGVIMAAGGEYPDDPDVLLAEADIVLSSEIRDMEALLGLAGEAAELFKAVPIGWPIDEYPIGSGFGYRKNPFTQEGREMHRGVDIEAPTGTEVRATAYGEVIFASFSDGGYGYLVEIDHGYGYSTYYAHCQSLRVKVGDEVARGQLIAYSGSSGRSTSAHLHYEVRINDVPHNPKPYMSWSSAGTEMEEEADTDFIDTGLIYDERIVEDYVC